MAAVAALACVAFLSLALGSAELEIGTVIGAFSEFDGSTGHLIVTELRLPRTLIGLAVGAALGLSGTLMQGVTRNPLAEPGILGINAGAALFVVLAIAMLGVSSVAGYVWFALAGAALASILVFGLGSVGRGGTTPVRLALAGAVLAALFSSLTPAVLVLDAQALDHYRRFIEEPGPAIIASGRPERSPAVTSASCATSCRSSSPAPSLRCRRVDSSMPSAWATTLPPPSVSG